MGAKAKAGNDRVNSVLANKPVLYSWLDPLWEAYQHLGRDRSLGPTTPGPIPWSAMNNYAIRHGIEGEAFDRFVAVIEAMDGVYLGHMASRAKTSGGAAGRRR